MTNAERFEELLGCLEDLSPDEREVLWRRLGAVRRKKGEDSRGA